jgi:hypothetical protein
MTKYYWIAEELMHLCDGGYDKKTCTGVHQGRKVRLNINGLVDIGGINFDRWANSIEVTITPKNKKRFASQFHNAFAELKGEK